MNFFQHNSDKLDRRGFISKESILSLVTQEEIFELVFKKIPQEFELVCSPLRVDKNPGCWFEYSIDNKLRFIDYGNPNVFQNIRLNNIDCFDMVQAYFKIPNFYLTLDFIKNNLLIKKENTAATHTIKQIKPTELKVKNKTKIVIESRPFEQKDILYWKQYGIFPKQLIEDKVLPLKKLFILNGKKGSFHIDCSIDLAYSYNDFEEARKKIYFPLKKGKKRFITNCTRNDVGGINSISQYSKQLIITKSYKDYRVLKNSGKNVVWFQNEGMIPDKTIINKLGKLSDIIVWFDNDQTGIQASEKIKQYLNSISPGIAKNLWLPEKALELGIKDPSDCLAKDPDYFRYFLKTFT